MRAAQGTNAKRVCGLPLLYPFFLRFKHLVTTGALFSLFVLQVGLIAMSPFCLAAQDSVPMSVTGRILGPDSISLKDTVVALTPTGMRFGLSPILEQHAGVQGEFALKAVAGTYNLTITAPGFLPYICPVTLKNGAPGPSIDVRMEKGGHRIQGTLLPAPGFNLEGARLGFSKASHDYGQQFLATVRHGRFDISLAPGTYLVSAVAKGQDGTKHLEVKEDQIGLNFQLSAEPSPANLKTLSWIKKNAISLQGVEAGRGFGDMQPIKAVVGDAAVVALGEATHGTREFFLLKHRMLEFLASEMGFTVFAIEAGQPEARAVNEYVISGKGNPSKALTDLGFWTWDTEEVLDLIRWMRSYNEDPAHPKKLRFYGIDMQFDVLAYAQAKAWLDSTNPAEAANLCRIKGLMIRLPSPFAGSMTEEGRNGWASVNKDVEALIVRLKAHPLADKDSEYQLQNLRIISQHAELAANPDEGDKVRDEAMATNLQWVRTQEPGAKIVLWAHNGHISFRPGSEDGSNGLGWHLRKMLGQAYRPIGFAFSEGTFRLMRNSSVVKPHPMGTLDAALAATGLPILALDLRKLPKSGSVRRWFDSPQGTWRIGTLFRSETLESYIEKEPICTEYDALFFVKTTSAARPAPILPADPKSPVNLGFEEGFTGWSNADYSGYETQLTECGVKEGARALQVAFVGTPNPNAWWKVEQTFDASSFQGKKLRFCGWIRTDGSPDFKARFWVRVYRKDGTGFFDSKPQTITSTDWIEAFIEGPVATDAVNITIGCTVMGKGSACFDGLNLETVP